MSFAGKLGNIDSRPANIILGGDAPTGGSNIFDRTIESALSLTQSASCTTHTADASNALAMAQMAATPIPYHKDATSTLSPTQTATSSIKMLTASSALSLTATASKNVHDATASSALALSSAANANIFDKVASSALSLTDAARPGLRKPVATSAMALTQEAIEAGGRRDVSASSALALTVSASTPRTLHKSASNSIVLVSAAFGIGPTIASASSPLSLSDEARSGIWTKSATSILVLSDVGRKTERYIVSASSPISLTESASAVNLHVYASSALSLNSIADTREKPRSAETTIDTLTSTATAQVVHNAASVITLTSTADCATVGLRAESQFVLTHEARNTSVKLGVREQTLELTQEATTNIKMLSLVDTISLIQTLFANRPWHVAAVSELTTIEEVFDLNTFTLIEVVTGLQSSASCTVNSVRRASNILSFAQQAIGSHVRADGIDCDAENILSLTQEGRLSIPKSAHSTLGLSQTASANVSIPVVSELSTLNVEAQVLVVRGASASNALEMKQSVAFIFEKSDTLCTYSPFVGSSSDPNAPTPPAATYPAAGVTPGFRLQYPASGPVTDQLILRAPNLGNQDRLAMTRINRETRGGTLIIYADPIWPKVQTLLLSFSGLSYQESQNLLAFMENYLGQEIKLIDWEDRLWRGVIVNPQDPVVPDGPGCKFTASFEFEGEKV